MTESTQELQAIHALACAAVTKADRTATPEHDAFWPLYLQAAIDTLRDRATPFGYVYLYPSIGGPVWRTDTDGREINGSRPMETKALFAIPPAPADLTPAARDVLTERRRQVDGEGFTIEHDDEHDAGDLASAASAYALNAACRLNPFMKAPLCETSLADELCADTGNRKVPTMWPLNWGAEWWKPKRPREDLVRAAALILGEIERIDRDPGDESGNHNINGGDL